MIRLCFRFIYIRRYRFLYSVWFGVLVKFILSRGLVCIICRTSMYIESICATALKPNKIIDFDREKNFEERQRK